MPGQDLTWSSKGNNPTWFCRNVAFTTLCDKIRVQRAAQMPEDGRSVV